MEVIEIEPKWYDLAEKNLDQGDKIQKSFRGKFDGEKGYIIMSNRKLQFLQEEGFLHKVYYLILDLPYEKIRKISCEGRYDLDLTEIDGKQHRLKTFELPVSIIEKSLEDLIKSVHA